ncbi:hypothetical protein ACFWIP_40640, partial [Streptomyces anulatus]|uniref:hypothetical protein n=1 Tax=Streptomyces anulatus TaxID=1892 RepID=UPI003662F9AA
PRPGPAVLGPGPPPAAAAHTRGRPTVPGRLGAGPHPGTDSRRAGLGPSCDAKLHPAPPDIRTRRHEVDQDPLPGT